MFKRFTLFLSNRRKKKTKPIFGSKVDSVHGNIFVEECMNFLLHHAIDLEGVFRLCGSKSKVAEYKKQIDAGKKLKFDISEDDPLDVASLLKLYFREMTPEPILTYNMYESFISAVQEKSREKMMVSKLLELLPVPNLLMLTKLINFLKKFSENEWKTKMSPKNLAICFGPNLISAREESVGLVIAHAIHVTNLVTLLIEQSNFFFAKITPILEELDAIEPQVSPEDIEHMDLASSVTPETSKKLSKKEQKKQEKEREKEREKYEAEKGAEMERLVKQTENERQQTEKEKFDRSEKRRLINEKWEQSSLNTDVLSDGQVPESEEARKQLEEKRKIKNEQWEAIRREEKERAKKMQVKIREERQRIERERMEEALLIKKQMEQLYNVQTGLIQDAQESLMANSGLQPEEYNNLQRARFEQIMSGENTYNDLLQWTQELNKYMKDPPPTSSSSPNPTLVISNSSSLSSSSKTNSSLTPVRSSVRSATMSTPSPSFNSSSPSRPLSTSVSGKLGNLKPSASPSPLLRATSTKISSGVSSPVLSTVSAADHSSATTTRLTPTTSIRNSMRNDLSPPSAFGGKARPESCRPNGSPMKAVPKFSR